MVDNIIFDEQQNHSSNNSSNNIQLDTFNNNNNQHNNNNNNNEDDDDKITEIQSISDNNNNNSHSHCNNSDSNSNECSEESNKAFSPIDYDVEMKKLKINYSICVFIFYAMTSIFFGGMMLGLPWLTTQFYNSKGEEICEKDIHLGDKRPPLQRSDQIHWDDYQNGHKVLTTSLVSTILLFLDVVMMLPVLLFRNFYSMIPELIYYALDWSLLIVILSSFKSYYLIPLSFTIAGCTAKSSFSNSLGNGFIFAIVRLAALKLFRILVSFYFIYRSQYIAKQQKQQQKPKSLYEKTKTSGPLSNIIIQSFHDLTAVADLENN